MKQSRWTKFKNRFRRKRPLPPPPVYAIILGRVRGSDGDWHTLSGAYGERLSQQWQRQRVHSGGDPRAKTVVVSKGQEYKLRGAPQRLIVRVHGEPSDEILTELMHQEALFDKICHG